MEKQLKKFSNSLVLEKKDSSTQEIYSIFVNQFNTWLQNREKNLDNANEIDIRDWAQIKKNKTYLYALLKYYQFAGLQKQQAVVRQVLKGMPKPVKKQSPAIQWNQFQNYLSEVKTTCRTEQYLAFLNLLWSEMKLRDIINLTKSDIDFSNSVIHGKDRDYYITKEAWIALKDYVRTEDRATTEHLFAGINHMRYAHMIIKQHFGNDYNLVAKNLRESCREDLMALGRKNRFVIPDSRRPLIEEVPRDSKVEPQMNPELFDRLVNHMFSFKKTMINRIKRVVEERDLLRLLEGYLKAALPTEVVIHEHSFSEWKNNSRIDFIIGAEQIPIEVELCGKKKIGDCMRSGSAQVKEFMIHHQSPKGIVVIGDTEQNSKNYRFTGFKDGIYTIVV